MDLEYTSSRRAIAKWYWRSLLHNRRHLALWLIVVLGTGVVVAGQTMIMGGSPTRASVTGLITALVMAAVLALYPQARFKSQRRTLSLTPDGITTTIRGRAASWSWSQVAQAAIEDDHLVLTMKNLNALVVPPAAFATPQARDDLLKLCLAWIRSEPAPPAA